MDLKERLGFPEDPTFSRDELLQQINIKLASLGCPTIATGGQTDFYEIAAALVSHHLGGEKRSGAAPCGADQRLQKFLDNYFQGEGIETKLPSSTLILDRHGLARALSVPCNGDEFASSIVKSYRVKQGILHNPRADRRTTQGLFHISEGGLPIPDDKLALPRKVAAELFRRAFSPPAELMRLPFTANQASQAECWVSVYLRPLVCPAVPRLSAAKTSEIRFFAPGSLVGNLDFVESIFGNAGDPFRFENDAAFDVEHWTGHTGGVILATHLVGIPKKEIGLPHYDQATERQRRDGMCWKDPAEPYNGGQAFKVTCRDASGVMVTVIADNYFGYCKKEVKTQISFAANLFGGCEEEHAGGAIVFPSYDLGEEFSGHLHVPRLNYSYDEMLRLLGSSVEAHPDGYAVDREHPEIIYVSEDVRFEIRTQKVSWPHPDGEKSMKLLLGKTYVRPSGYKVKLEKAEGVGGWRLVGTVAEGNFCHKPCTVSGGGKSEISKSIADAILQGPVFVADFHRDFDEVARLLKRSYADRFKDQKRRDSRPILSPERSLGSVIKLLTPASRDYNSDYNEWLRNIPQHVKQLVYLVKRFYKPEWGDDWRSHFSVDTINGNPGNELKCDNRKVYAQYLRVGFEGDGSWRVFGLRHDFHPAAKIQLEDDISASTVAAAINLPALNPEYNNLSVKLVSNCEFRLFQRPDDAIHRGYDKQTEQDFARKDNFFSNYQPLTPGEAKEMVDDSIVFDLFTPPMKQLITAIARDGAPSFFVSSAHPRLVEGKPSKNPRYLQNRMDLLHPGDKYLAEVATRLHRKIRPGRSVVWPVNSVVPGRRNNPPDHQAGIRALAVFGPLHYLELPELFMEFICSMTGKSPSTTGAGSEGALTKGPFNALLPIIDLNNALLAYLLTGGHGFVTAAGYVGPQARVDHDISYLVPEVFCRMTVLERDPSFLFRNGYLERCEDFTAGDKRIPMSMLGYRITPRFVRTYFGRIFNHPQVVFSENMLKPEKQDLDAFIEGMETLVVTQQRVAEHYFSDGSIELACPPLKSLLEIMRQEDRSGAAWRTPAFRNLFNREAVVGSVWYRARLQRKQEIDRELFERHRDTIQLALKETSQHSVDQGALEEKFKFVRRQLERITSPDYLDSLVGTLGTDPGAVRVLK